MHGVEDGHPQGDRGDTNELGHVPPARKNIKDEIAKRLDCTKYGRPRDSAFSGALVVWNGMVRRKYFHFGTAKLQNPGCGETRRNGLFRYY